MLDFFTNPNKDDGMRRWVSSSIRREVDANQVVGGIGIPPASPRMWGEHVQAGDVSWRDTVSLNLGHQHETNLITS
jgi:hypothetical protein